MCTVHGGAEESTSAFTAALWRLFSAARGVEEGGGRKRVEADKREWNFEAFSSAVVKGPEWERGPCSQPHGLFSLWIMEAFLWFLTPLSHAGSRQPSTRPSQQTRSKHVHPLDNWILHPGKSLPSLARSPTTRGSDRNSPMINMSCGEGVGVRLGVRKNKIKRQMVLWCEGDHPWSQTGIQVLAGWSVHHFGSAEYFRHCWMAWYDTCYRYSWSLNDFGNALTLSLPLTSRSNLLLRNIFVKYLNNLKFEKIQHSFHRHSRSPDDESY